MIEFQLNNKKFDNISNNSTLSDLPLFQEVRKTHPCWKTTGGPKYAYLLEKAREKRKNPTPAERIIWQVLRNKRFGVKFRRQHIIGEYIADFVNLENHLILEIDGKYHYTFNQNFNDTIRTEFLNRQGFTVLRFSNEEVLTDIDKVISIIDSYFKK